MLLPKDRIWNQVVATTRRWGFGTRVTLRNLAGFDVALDVAVRDEHGKTLAHREDVGRIPNGTGAFFDLGELGERLGLSREGREDRVFTFALIPDEHRAATAPVEVPGELFGRLAKTSEIYVEHYDPETGFSSGLLYGTPRLNDRMILHRSSFLMQAPKVFLSEERNTHLQVIFYSSDPDLDVVGSLHLGLRVPDGTRVHAWVERVHSHGVRFVDVKRVLHDAGYDWRKVVGPHGFLYLEGVSSDYGFLPVIINMNETRRTFDCEHSLPPIYYGKSLVGPAKQKLIDALQATYAGTP